MRSYACRTRALPKTAIHFPRRRVSRIPIPLRFNARSNCGSCSRKTPDRISHFAHFSFGKTSISNSLNRFAVMISILAGNFHRRTSATRKSTCSILFCRAFLFAVAIAIGSWSIAIIRFAPKRAAANARIPEPVPRSRIENPLAGDRRLRACARRQPFDGWNFSKQPRLVVETGRLSACALE